MFGRRIPLFKIFGFEVRIDTSWIFLAILIVWSLSQGVFPFEYPNLDGSTYWWMGIAGSVGLFASILLHELSHSLVAKYYDLPMKGITLFIFGGVAEMEGEAESPKVEFRMAAIGPVISILLGGLFYGISRMGEGFLWSDAVTGVFSYLGTINLVLAGFNLIPAFPLDGGRVLRAGLWKWKGNLVEATWMASRSGTVFGVILMVLGALGFLRGNFIGGMWWVLIGMFLKDAAKLSYQQVLVQHTLHGETIRRYMNPDPVSVPPSLSLQDFVNDYLYRHQHKMYPVTEGTRLMGCIQMRDLKKFPNIEWSRHTVSELVIPCSSENVVGPETDAKEVLSLMSRTGNSRLLVAERDSLLGVVTLKDMMKVVSLRLELEDFPTQEAA